jgi:hypothetical protein
MNRCINKKVVHTIDIEPTWCNILDIVLNTENFEVAENLREPLKFVDLIRQAQKKGTKTLTLDLSGRGIKILYDDEVLK